MITQLKSHQIFVYGSNAGGFHGAGSAGLAMRGDSKNTWRNDQSFLDAMNSPVGSDKRIGKWAVYGQATGHQIGREGQSYAIKTIVRPGQRRSVSLQEIQDQFECMFEFAEKHPDLELLMTTVGCGYSGYTPSEMKGCWDQAIKNYGCLPVNITIPDNFYDENPPYSET